mmetsp:Transcript_17797/g.29009  ORF Transcript_17797/g.29009 Transcript_17797/m.29009 type:complete len:347 (-) Transcript_17797:103-1143(-)
MDERDHSRSPKRQPDNEPTLDLSRARDVAVEAVLKACRVTTLVQKELVHDDVVAKGDRSPVTIADYASQAIISHELQVAFPLIPLMGEEDAGHLRQHVELATKVLDTVKQVLPDITQEQTLDAIDRGRHGGGPGLFWALDPIDGTKGFLRKEQYAVCLCLIEDGKVLVSVLGCPNLPVEYEVPDSECGCLFIAVRGFGATQRAIASNIEKKIAVSTIADCSNACCVESVEAAHSDHSRQGTIVESLNFQPPVLMDSQCKFGVVARGQASLYLRLAKDGRHHQLWDIAAGAMLVEEAGGSVTDAEGRPLNFALDRTVGVSELFASNGLIHSRVLEALQSERHERSVL